MEDPVTPNKLFPTVEPVDEDYEPEQDPKNSRSRRDSLDSSSSTEAGFSLVSSAPPSPNANFPGLVSRPSAYRETSLAPPSTVSDLYNATPGSSPAPTSRIPFDTRSESIISKFGDLRIESTAPAENDSDTHVECIAAQLAQVQIESDDSPPHRPVPVREEQLPQAPFFDPNLQTAIKKAQKIMANVAGQLEAVELANNPESGLYALRTHALASREFEIDAIRTIGIVGESAAGRFNAIRVTLF